MLEKTENGQSMMADKWLEMYKMSRNWLTCVEMDREDWRGLEMAEIC